MPVAPYYEALSVEETLTYLRAVAGSVDIPVMLYNLPVATGVDLNPDTVGALAREVENIRYIKNTTVDMDQSARLIHNHGEDTARTAVGLYAEGDAPRLDRPDVEAYVQLLIDESEEDAHDQAA